MNRDSITTLFVHGGILAILEISRETALITPERRKQLDDYARRHGQDSTTALDEALAEWLAEERGDFDESVEAIRRGFEDVAARRTRPASELFADKPRKYGFPGEISFEAELVRSRFSNG